LQGVPAGVVWTTAHPIDYRPEVKPEISPIFKIGEIAWSLEMDFQIGAIW
jgi:hypothetical protein